MARHKKKTSSNTFGLLDDLEGMVDKAVGSVEHFGESATGYDGRVFSWAKKHKKLIVLGVLALVAYNYLKNAVEENEDEEE